MDVNNTKIHLLMGKTDWKPVFDGFNSSNLYWDEDCAGLSLKPLLFRFKTRPLFRVDLGFQTDLDSGNISARLRQEFEKNSVPLAQNATVSLEQEDRKWLITGNGQMYVIKKEDGKLNIYLHPLRPKGRRGSGIDQFGNWYWIAEDKTEILFLARDAQKARHFWSVDDMVTSCEVDESNENAFKPCPPPPPPAPLKLRGLAVTEQHYLVVGVCKPPGLLIFDLHAGGPPIQVLWPTQVPFAPFDLAPAPDGGVWILDLPPDGSTPRYWALDRHFRVITVAQENRTIESPVPYDFQPVAGELQRRPERVFPTGIELSLSSPVALSAPVAIEGLPDCSALILESDANLPYSTVYRYFFGTLLGQTDLELLLFHVKLTYQTELNNEEMSENLRQEFVDEKISLSQEVTVSIKKEDSEWLIIDNGNNQIYTVKKDEYRLNIYAPLKGHDFAFIPNQNELKSITGMLYVADIDGNQTFVFDLEATATDLYLKVQHTKYFPMRRFGGKGLVSDGEVVYYDYKEQWFPLVEHERPRYNEEGTGTTLIFDGKEPDCVWHRVFLDAFIPPGAGVEIKSRAGNDGEMLERVPWQTEPRPYLREGDAELPYYRPYAPRLGKAERIGTWELLLQKATGRYLQLSLKLQGTGQNTPWIRALRVYYPRFSYLREYLPALYREDETSASFLDRFLTNVEGFYTVLEDKIAQAQFLFDVRTTPAEYLDWLAGWLGVLEDLGGKSKSDSGAEHKRNQLEERRRRLFIKYAPQLFSQRGTVSGLIRTIRLATDPCPDESIFEEDFSRLATESKTAPRSVRGSVRIVENYLTRLAPGVVFGDPTDVEGPGVTTDIYKWTPEQGAEPLHKRYRDYLEKRYQKNIDALNEAWVTTDYKKFEEILMPPVQPPNSAEADDWQRFLSVGLGFTYAPITASDRFAYQNFLARRYRRVERLKRAYQLTEKNAPTSFDQVELPEEDDMPSGGKRLFDWIQFVSLALPISRNAHRFTVLVPIDSQIEPVAREQLLNLVRRIVELEKPANTAFDVRGYWDFFRIGEARLGIDTALGEGSRFVGMVIGRHYLADGYLQPSHPMNVRERMVSDRDRLGDMPSL